MRLLEDHDSYNRFCWTKRTCVALLAGGEYKGGSRVLELYQYHGAGLLRRVGGSEKE